MGSLSELSIWQFFQRRPLLCVVTLASILVLIVATLTVCFFVSRPHVNWARRLPAISALGNLMPEHIPFAIGFTLISLLFGLVVFIRAGQLDAASPGSVTNILIAALGWFGVPALIVMGCVPDSVSESHFIGAGVAMVCFALHAILTSVFCIVHSCCSCMCLGGIAGQPDHKVPLALRIVLYLFSIAAASVSVTLFVYWMLLAHEENIFEWVGVALIFTAYFPLGIFFAYIKHDLHGTQYQYISESEPLVKPSII